MSEARSRTVIEPRSMAIIIIDDKHHAVFNRRRSGYSASGRRNCRAQGFDAHVRGAAAQP